MLVIINITETIIASISDTTIESHIPFRPKNKGKTRMHAIWKISVRINEIAADIKPLLSAVKNDAPKKDIPQNKNENENIVNAFIVIWVNSLS